jgi:heat-inducible transcriptional repressor
LSPSDDILDPRHRDVLKSIIREHVVTGEPVGSKTVSRGGGLDLSPATIRNIMAELEERGLLSQPHTSAGRIPTDLAYRLYVDRLMGRRRMSSVQTSAIDEALERTRGEFPELLEEASRQLSRLSSHVGVVLAPEWRRIVVEQLEFVRLGPRRAVAILVGRSGVVHNRILELDDPVEQSELDRIGSYLSERYHGWTLPKIREELERRITEERETYNLLASRALALGRRAVELSRADSGVFIEGTSNLLNSPEFSDIERMRSVFRTLEEKSRLVEMLGRVLDEDGVQVVIGQENENADLATCSLVASPYHSGQRVVGTVGIVGPTRMQYARAVALVDYLAQVLSRLLSTTDH